MKKSPFKFTLLPLLLTAAFAIPVFAQSTAMPDTSTPPGNRTYSNGAPQQQIEQSRSRRTERSYYPSGGIQRESVWAMNGAKHVPERDAEYSSTGMLLRERRWAGGEPVVELDYLSSGMLVKRKEYMGMGTTREMLIQEYFSSGVLSSEERFAVLPGGRQFPVGSQKKYGVSGNPLTEKIFDDQGKLVEEKAWNASGQLLAPNAR